MWCPHMWTQANDENLVEDNYWKKKEIFYVDSCLTKWGLVKILELQSCSFIIMNEMMCNSVQICTPPPSLAMQTYVFCNLSFMTSMQLPPHQNHLLHLTSCRYHSASSTIHSIHDNLGHLFMCRFVSDWSAIITHCQKQAKNYISFAILLWIIH